MNDKMKTWLQKLLPNRIWAFLRQIYHGVYARFFKVSPSDVWIECGDFRLRAPAHHALASLKKRQPLRDEFVGVTARLLSERYPDSTLVDIGANIGDTVALMATHSRNPIVAVEPSDLFHRYLVENCAQIPNSVEVLKIVVGDGKDLEARLEHFAGTARILQDQGAGNRMETRCLAEVAPEGTRFIKLDTDGFDFGILLSNLAWVETHKPAVLLEVELPSETSFQQAMELFQKLVDGGFTRFVVWDDAGYLLLSTDSMNVLEHLFRYLLRISKQEGIRSIYNYDILCLPKRDEDLHTRIEEWYALR